MQAPQITLEDDNFIYHFDTGKIFIKLKNGDIRETGLSKDKDGYHQIWISDKMCKVHRVLYAKYHSMKIPNDKVIDHIDRNPSNNKIENLRLVTRSENSQNQSIKKNNTSNHKNIFWDEKCCKWRIRIGDKYYGSFEELAQAVLHRNLMINFLNNATGTFYTILD